MACEEGVHTGHAPTRISFGRCLKETRALQKNEDVYKLTAEMRNYVTWYRKNGMDPFFHRKSDRVVLAVLHVEYGGQACFARGINSEVSLPTGSICAERAAIANARTHYPGTGRKQMKGIAVLEVPVTVGRVARAGHQELQNPLPPCGACREWLNKIQEESPGFYVLTFEDLSLEVVHERFLFWSQEETAMAKKDLGPWTCNQCGHKNIPLSAICGQCHVDRFSMSYLRAPKKRVFHNIIQALSSHGPMTSQQLEARLRAEGHPLSTPKALMAKLKLLQRSSKASKGSNSILHLDKENRFHVTETGQQFWNRQHHWHQKRVQEKVTSMKIPARTELEYMDATSTQAQAELEETMQTAPGRIGPNLPKKRVASPVEPSGRAGSTWTNDLEGRIIDSVLLSGGTLAPSTTTSIWLRR